MKQTNKQSKTPPSYRARETAQQVRAFAAQPDDLSLNPRTHTAKGKKRLFQVVL